MNDVSTDAEAVEARPPPSEEEAGPIHQRLDIHRMCTNLFVLLLLNGVLGVNSNLTCWLSPCDCCKTGNCTFSDDGKYLCSSCIDGFTSFTCNEPCPETCLRCSQAFFSGDRICYACKNGYYNGRQKDIVEYPLIKDCSLSCQLGCEICRSYEICDKCKISYFKSSGNKCIKCSPNCAICKSTKDCVTCLDGYFNEGNGCQQCKPHCKTCHSYSSCTECDPEFYLASNECNRCPKGCISCNGSKTCHSCNLGFYHTNGRFLKETCSGCENGYSSVDEDCQQCPINCTACSSASSCTSCKAGSYGETCSLSCPHRCHNKECQQTSGHCFACVSGYTGKVCENYCSNCKPGTRCDLNNGFCFSSCKDGLSAKLCNINCDFKCRLCSRVNQHECLSCIHERYGKSCDEECPKTCLNHTCNDTNGVCVDGCTTGYWGLMCDRPCSRNCVDKICKFHDGTCLKETPNTLVIVLAITFPILGAILIIVAIIVIIRRNTSYSCRRNQKYKERKSCATLDQPRSTLQDTYEQSFFLECTDDNSNTLEEGDSCADASYTSATKVESIEIHSAHTQQDGDTEIIRAGIPNIEKEKESGSDFEKDGSFEARVIPYISFISIGNCQYIASVGSNKLLMNDMTEFWKLVWEQRCLMIVMLTHLTEELENDFEHYLSGKSECGCIIVSCQEERNFKNYAMRFIKLKMQTQERVVSLFRYLGWPDRGIPTNISSFLEFHSRVYISGTNLDGPTIVHCSIGLHRVALYIAFDILTRRGKTQGSTVGCLEDLRVQGLDISPEQEKLFEKMCQSSHEQK